ncbi:hypothetical protein A2U01_0041422, partial [Trifolium medium]|nr:hypothetical protein [Trifolium medium]
GTLPDAPGVGSSARDARMSWNNACCVRCRLMGAGPAYELDRLGLVLEEI